MVIHQCRELLLHTNQYFEYPKANSYKCKDSGRIFIVSYKSRMLSELIPEIMHCQVVFHPENALQGYCTNKTYTNIGLDFTRLNDILINELINSGLFLREITHIRLCKKHYEQFQKARSISIATLIKIYHDKKLNHQWDYHNNKLMDIYNKKRYGKKLKKS